jgi:hypothetical protein
VFQIDFPSTEVNLKYSYIIENVPALDYDFLALPPDPRATDVRSRTDRAALMQTTASGQHSLSPKGNGHVETRTRSPVSGWTLSIAAGLAMPAKGQWRAER